MPIDKKIIDAATAASGTVTVPMQSYEHALLHVKCATGGDFDLAVTATATALSGDSAVSVVPSGTDVSDISDILLPLGPTGAESLTVAWSNLSNNSGPHTITAATGYVDGQNVNVNSTLTTDAGPRTGTLTRALTGLNTAPGMDVDGLTATGGGLHVGDDARSTLTIADSADAGNDGDYTVAVTGATTLDATPDFSSADDDTTTPALAATVHFGCGAPVIAPGADLSRISANAFDGDEVGRNITVSSSADAGNDGTYAIASLVNGTTAEVTPDFSTPDDDTTTPALDAVITVALTNPSLGVASLDRLETTVGTFIAYDTNYTAVVSGAADVANNGTYAISTYVSATRVLVSPSFNSSESGGTLAVSISRTLSSVVLAPGTILNRLQSVGDFAAGDVGRSVEVVGAGPNDGTYTISAFVDADNVTVTPAFAEPETGATVTVTLTLSGVSIAQGANYNAITSGSDMFSTYDVGRTITIPAGPAAGTYEVDTVVSAQSITVVETLPAITTGTAATLTGALTGLDFAPGGTATRIHAATAQFAEVDEGASVAVTGSTWAINGYLRLWSEGKK